MHQLLATKDAVILSAKSDRAIVRDDIRWYRQKVKKIWLSGIKERTIY